MVTFPTEFKDWVDSTQSLLTVAAIIAGGCWFWRRRQQLPRAKTTHALLSWPLPDGRWLLRVVVSIENQGEVLLELEQGFTHIQQMRPWPEKVEPLPAQTVDRKTEIEWPLLAEMNVDFTGQHREIEPHESDTVPFEFILPAEAQMVVVYTYIRNKAKKPKRSAAAAKEVGWSVTTVHELVVPDAPAGRLSEPAFRAASPQQVYAETSRRVQSSTAKRSTPSK